MEYGGNINEDGANLGIMAIEALDVILGGKSLPDKANQTSKKEMLGLMKKTYVGKLNKTKKRWLRKAKAVFSPKIEHGFQQWERGCDLARDMWRTLDPNT